MLSQVNYERVLTGYTSGVTSVAFSPDGGTLASASGGEIHLRDAITGIHKQILHAETDWVNSLAFSPDGRNARQWER